MALSDRALFYIQDVLHSGKLASFTHYGVAGSPGGGPYFELWALIEEGKIQRASFESMGCPTSKAIGSALCILIEGRDIEKLGHVDEATLIGIIGGIPEGKEHIPPLAVTALKILTMEKKPE